MHAWINSQMEREYKIKSSSKRLYDNPFGIINNWFLIGWDVRKLILF